jgi:hypothetical protein
MEAFSQLLKHGIVAGKEICLRDFSPIDSFDTTEISFIPF